MKKIIYLVFAFSVIATQSIYAQYNAGAEAATTKGDVILDIGVGFFGGYYNGYNGRGPGDTYWSYNNGSSRVQVPTLSLSLQKAFFNDVTIGGEFAFNIFGNEHDLRQSDGYYQHSTYVQTNLFFLGRGEYHFGRLIGWGPKADLYAGALAGVRATTSSETNIYEGWGNGQPGSWRNDYPNKKSTSVGPSGAVFGGIRYYFAGNTSVYVEAGAGLTNLRTGLAWRF